MAARSTGRVNGTAVLRTLRSIPDECKKRAGRGKDFCEGVAPVDTGRYKTGEPIPAGETGGGFHVTDVETSEGFGGARLSNDTPYAWFLERGWTAQNGREIEGRHILHSSIDAMRGR